MRAPIELVIMGASKEDMETHLLTNVLQKREDQTWEQVLPKEMAIPAFFNIPAKDTRLKWVIGSGGPRKVKTIRESFYNLSQSAKNHAERDGICSSLKLESQMGNSLTKEDKERLDLAIQDLIYLFSFPPVDKEENPIDNPTQKAEQVKKKKMIRDKSD